MKITTSGISSQIMCNNVAFCMKIIIIVYDYYYLKELAYSIVLPRLFLIQLFNQAHKYYLDTYVSFRNILFSSCVMAHVILIIAYPLYSL